MLTFRAGTDEGKDRVSYADTVALELRKNRLALLGPYHLLRNMKKGETLDEGFARFKADEDKAYKMDDLRQFRKKDTDKTLLSYGNIHKNNDTDIEQLIKENVAPDDIYGLGKRPAAQVKAVKVNGSDPAISKVLNDIKPIIPDERSTVSENNNEINTSERPAKQNDNNALDDSESDPNSSYDDSKSDPNSSYDDSKSDPNSSYDDSKSDPNSSYDDSKSDPNSSYNDSVDEGKWEIAKEIRVLAGSKKGDQLMSGFAAEGAKKEIKAEGVTNRSKKTIVRSTEKSLKSK